MQSSQTGTERQNATSFESGDRLEFHRSSDGILSYQELERRREASEAKAAVVAILASGSSEQQQAKSVVEDSIESLGEAEYIRRGIEKITRYLDQVRRVELADRHDAGV